MRGNVLDYLLFFFKIVFWGFFTFIHSDRKSKETCSRINGMNSTQQATREDQMCWTISW